MPWPPPPPSWTVETTDNGDGTFTVRYAYADGYAANVVVPAHRYDCLDHVLVAGLVRVPPPAAKRPKA